MPAKKTINRIPLESVRLEHLLIWGIGSFVLVVVFAAQCVLGKYTGDDVGRLWSWFLPTTLPTLALAVGVYSATGHASQDNRSLKVGFRNLLRVTSLAYLFLVAMGVLLEPLSPLPDINVLMMSNYWLGPAQGVVSATIGYAFMKDDQDRPKA